MINMLNAVIHHVSASQKRVPIPANFFWVSKHSQNVYKMFSEQILYIVLAFHCTISITHMHLLLTMHNVFITLSSVIIDFLCSESVCCSINVLTLAQNSK